MKLPEPVDDPRHPLEEFFEPLRGHRRMMRAEPGDVKTSALITMVHNETVFLPIWLRYYSQHFAPEDIYVLDNGRMSRSTKKGGFVRIPVRNRQVDHTWMVRTIEQHQHELLQRYDNVLVTDVDEIVVPTPALGTLADYLAGFQEEFVNCLGYEILHLRDREPPFLPNVPVLDQRSYWFANDTYDKPILASWPTTWQPGFHRTSDDRWTLDPDLRLIHLHRMDYDVCMERHRVRSRRRWAKLDQETGWAKHNLVSDEAEFERWFYSDGNAGGEIVLEEIPAEWKGLF